MSVFFTFLLSAVFVFFLFVAISIFNKTVEIGISPMPTLKKMRYSLFKTLPKIHRGTVYDLGSGFGFLLPMLSKKYPKLQIVGYEISYFPFLVSKFVIAAFNLKNVKVYHENYLDVPIDDAGLIVCYLFRDGMRLLEEKIEKDELSCILVSHTFALPKKKPVVTKNAIDLYRTEIFFYSF